MNFRKSFIMAFSLYLLILGIAYTSFYVGKEPLASTAKLNGIPHYLVKILITPIYSHSGNDRR